MPRNMIKQNQKIFSSLQNKIFISGDISQEIFSGRRHITTNELEKEWLKNLKIIDQQSLFDFIQFALFEFEDKFYFVYVGEELSDTIIAGLSPFEINAGIFTALASELKIHVKASGTQLLEHIFYQDFDDDGEVNSLDKWAYEWSDVSRFFIPIRVFRISDDFSINPRNYKNFDISRFIAYFLIKTKNHFILDFYDETLIEYEKIITEGSMDDEGMSFDNLLSSLISNKWKYAFLEVYRCLENLFGVIKVKPLHQKMGNNMNIFDFLNTVNEDLGWRPKEDSAIEEIIDKTSEDIKNLFSIIKLGTIYEDTTVSKFLYQIRNCIVHFRSGLREPELEDDQWNKLIQATIRLTEFWYSDLENYKKSYANS